MINIINKEDCVGCNGCVQICPQKCITFICDSQGFYYPKVDVSECINCGLCNKVCPVENQPTPTSPIKVYCAKNIEKSILESSSSGGVFYAIAKLIIDEGGVVFGAGFDENWNVRHTYTEDLNGLVKFQTSKYVQSDISESYINASKFLKEGRKVLFSGTPCQISGLKLYLRKDYGAQLTTVEVICHGVPSPGIWHEYLTKLSIELSTSKEANSSTYDNGVVHRIKRINFRDKKLGWQKFGLSIHIDGSNKANSPDSKAFHYMLSDVVFFQPFYENPYMLGFLNDLYLRPSCYACPAKSGKSQADISLADFWGIDKKYPEHFKNNFFSLVLVYSSNGIALLSEAAIEFCEVTYQDALSSNPAIIKSAKKPEKYYEFWKLYERIGLESINVVNKSMQPNFIRRSLHFAKRIVHKFLSKI